LLAKGRLLGVQFEEFFKDGLYFEIGKHAVKMAMKIKEALSEAGIPLRYPAPTNQLFIEFTEEQFARISEKYVLLPWIHEQGIVVARLITDWMTPVGDVEAFIQDIRTL